MLLKEFILVCLKNDTKSLTKNKHFYIIKEICENMRWRRYFIYVIESN